MSSTHLAADPSLETCPDFSTDQWKSVRAAMINPSRTEEQVVKELETSWEASRQERVNTWAEQVRKDKEAEAAAAAARAEEDRTRAAGKDTEKDAEKEGSDEKKKHKLSDFDEDETAPDTFVDLPSAYARSRLEAQEYVELYYFTHEGRHEAANQSTTTEDTLGLMRNDDQITLRPTSTIRASKNVIPDTKLSWTQMTTGKTAFLKAATAAGWPEKHLNALATFFWEIENHPMLEREHGQAILLIYQAQTRAQWHDALRRPGAKKWNIANINDKAIDNIASKYYTDIQERLLGQVSRHPIRDELRADQSSRIRVNYTRRNRSPPRAIAPPMRLRRAFLRCHPFPITRNPNTLHRRASRPLRNNLRHAYRVPLDHA
ncbi:hypothetical protein EV121DRAFT_218375 [Schizophyllum commune]